MPVCLAALTLATGGCVVASKRFDAKVREADALRDALASVNREQQALQARVEALSKSLAEETDSRKRCETEARGREEELLALRREFEEASRAYEGTRLTREQFITELLEKEKVSGKRIQEWNTRALACEAERESLRKETASLKQNIAELEARVAETPDRAALRMERDILAGRVDRLMEERRLAEKERSARFDALVRDLSAISSEVSAVRAGTVLLLRIPGHLLRPGKKKALPKPAERILHAVGTSAAALPTATIVVSAEEPATSESIRDLLGRESNLSGERIRVAPGRGGNGSAELLLVVP
ncbi:MAG: hypothetical protein Kow00128_14070 [Deltaproteobacteria bacterium]